MISNGFVHVCLYIERINGHSYLLFKVFSWLVKYLSDALLGMCPVSFMD